MEITEDEFFKGCNVGNAALIKDGYLLCALNDEDGISKLMTVDLDADKDHKTELVLDQNEEFNSFDLDKVPGTGDDAYFILHQAQGLYLIDAINKMSYVLSYDDMDSANQSCRSVAVANIDDEDEERGFWLANIDNSNEETPEIKVFDFDNKFITELRKISQQVNEGNE